ncbi:family 16 glycosyl hydrolase [Coprinellus micaceus]|uniref:Family 16 glycosyl hydrolase n=1 Tax=Coprinellus micaceus TaxID=71717 RepID=A0A4Y7SSB6_COPMI|nr:family 16 glycosyl hydrolase [Coprinellus micaceus]
MEDIVPPILVAPYMNVTSEDGHKAAHMRLPLSQTLAVLSLVSSTLAATYRQHKEVIGEDFIEDAFTVEGISDPTHGRVTYVNKATAQRFNLTYATKDRFILRADSDSVVQRGEKGRRSVRMKSKDSYTRHVAVFDVRHMPTGCGTWPAIWEVGANWPNGGEIDILEGVNDMGPNAATLHTGANCVMSATRKGQRGQQVEENCDVKAKGNVGCPVRMKDLRSYGPEFNKAGGGYYAVERASNHIKVWFWSRDSESAPAAVKSGAKTVDPDTWGEPDAFFPGGQNCDINKKFGPQNIIINLTFCGDWAGSASVYSRSGCKGTCINHVDKNPQAFKEAYFDIASLRTYIP